MIKDNIHLQRSKFNPLITPQDVLPSFPDWEVIGVFNAGVAEYKGEVIMLLRVAERPRQTVANHLIIPLLQPDRATADDARPYDTLQLSLDDKRYSYNDTRVVADHTGRTVYLTSVSHLRLARSVDGEQFVVDETPTLWPSTYLESWGMEDPRITPIDEKFYITYSAVSERGVSVGLISTEDFTTYDRIGTILAPTNKDVVIFPERINGYYYMLHRPVPNEIGMPEMWIARSQDLKHWGDHQFLLGLQQTDARIGAGCVPIKTPAGWLLLYHGANNQHEYYMSALLVDLEQPSQVIARLDEPIMLPEADYERDGFFSSVVFACGAIVDGDQVTMYYGAADETMAKATFSLSALMEQFQLTSLK